MLIAGCSHSRSQCTACCHSCSPFRKEDERFRIEQVRVHCTTDHKSCLPAAPVVLSNAARSRRVPCTPIGNLPQPACRRDASRGRAAAARLTRGDQSVLAARRGEMCTRGTCRRASARPFTLRPVTAVSLATPTCARHSLHCLPPGVWPLLLCARYSDCVRCRRVVVYLPVV